MGLVYPMHKRIKPISPYIPVVKNQGLYGVFPVKQKVGDTIADLT